MGAIVQRSGNGKLQFNSLTFSAMLYDAMGEAKTKKEAEFIAEQLTSHVEVNTSVFIEKVWEEREGDKE